jgi:hypothetical protein
VIVHARYPQRLFAISILSLFGCQRAASSNDGVPAALVSRYPCPSSLPAAWTSADSSLGYGARCSLLQAAAHQVKLASTTNAVLARVNLSTVTCVQVHRWSFRDARTDSLKYDYWTVEFYSDSQPDALVRVDPVTGEGKASVGNREFGYSTRQLCAAAT